MTNRERRVALQYRAAKFRHDAKWHADAKRYSGVPEREQARHENLRKRCIALAKDCLALARTA